MCVNGGGAPAKDVMSRSHAHVIHARHPLTPGRCNAGCRAVPPDARGHLAAGGFRRHRGGGEWRGAAGATGVRGAAAASPPAGQRGFSALCGVLSRFAAFDAAARAWYNCLSVVRGGTIGFHCAARLSQPFSTTDNLFAACPAHPQLVTATAAADSRNSRRRCPAATRLRCRFTKNTRTPAQFRITYLHLGRIWSALSCFHGCVPPQPCQLSVGARRLGRVRAQRWNTRERHCLRENGSGTHNAKAVCYASPPSAPIIFHAIIFPATSWKRSSGSGTTSSCTPPGTPFEHTKLMQKHRGRPVELGVHAS